MRHIGIDVGVTGAIACLNSGGQLVGVFDMPVRIHGKTKWIDAVKLLGTIRALLRGEPGHATVEHLHAMPQIEKDDGTKMGGGVVAAHSKGLTLGSTLAILQLSGCQIELVTPMKWKRAQGLLMPGASDADKKAASLMHALKCYPAARPALERAKDHNRAEAILLADYGFRLRGGIG